MKRIFVILCIIALSLLIVSCQKTDSIQSNAVKVDNEIVDKVENENIKSRELIIKFTQDALLDSVGNKIENIPYVALYNDNTFEFYCNCYSEMVMFTGEWVDHKNSIYECKINSYKDFQGNDNPVNGIDSDIFKFYNITSDSFDICYIDGEDTAIINSSSPMGMTKPCDVFFINHNIVKINNFVSLPEVNVRSNILDSSYEIFKAKGNTKFEVSVRKGFLKCINDTEDDGIEYFQIDNHTYVGVKDGIIVMYATYGEPTRNQVKDWVTKDEFYLVSPKISMEDHRGHIGWKLANGNLIISVIATNGEWYDYMSDYIIYVKDLSQCNLEWK